MDNDGCLRSRKTEFTLQGWWPMNTTKFPGVELQESFAPVAIENSNEFIGCKFPLENENVFVKA